MLRHIGLNHSLQEEIVNKDFDRLAEMLCSSAERAKINEVTWGLLSGHIKGKPIRKSGPRPSREKRQRNEKAWLQHRQLMQEGYTRDEAIAEMAEIEADLQDEGKEPTEYEGRIRSYLQEHEKWQKELKMAQEEEDAISTRLMEEIETENLK